MKNVLFLAGIGVAAYAVYLLYNKKADKKTDSQSPTLVRMPKSVQLFPDSARQEFDAQWDALFPSRRAGGATILSADSLDTFQG